MPTRLSQQRDELQAAELPRLPHGSGVCQTTMHVYYQLQSSYPGSEAQAFASWPLTLSALEVFWKNRLS